MQNRLSSVAGQPDHRSSLVETMLGAVGLMVLTGAPIAGVIIATRPEHAGSLIIAEIGAIFGLFIGIAVPMTMMAVAWLLREFRH